MSDVVSKLNVKKKTRLFSEMNLFAKNRNTNGAPSVATVLKLLNVNCVELLQLVNDLIVLPNCMKPLTNSISLRFQPISGGIYFDEDLKKTFAPKTRKSLPVEVMNGSISILVSCCIQKNTVHTVHVIFDI